MDVRVSAAVYIYIYMCVTCRESEARARYKKAEKRDVNAEQLAYIFGSRCALAENNGLVAKRVYKMERETERERGGASARLSVSSFIDGRFYLRCWRPASSFRAAFSCPSPFGWMNGFFLFQFSRAQNDSCNYEFTCTDANIEFIALSTAEILKGLFHLVDLKAGV